MGRNAATPQRRNAVTLSAIVGLFIPGSAWADAPPFRIFRLRAELCSTSPGLEAVRLPPRSLARFPDPTVDPGFDDSTLSINDFGVVVGTFAVPAEPCDAPYLDDVLTPHAFVWLPRAPSQFGLPGVYPVQQVVDLHVAGGFAASAALSVGNDTPRSSQYAVGSVGNSLYTSARAKVWNLAQATSSGGVISVPVNDIHSRIEYPGFSIGSMSIAHGIYQPTASDPAMVVGTMLDVCEESVERGFVLDYTSTATAYRLWPADGTGESAAYDYSLDPDPAGSFLAVGWETGFEPLNPCGSTFADASCHHESSSSVFWLPPWDDDLESSNPDDGKRIDSNDGEGPSLEENPVPGGSLFAGSLNRALNAEGERVGMGWRYGDPPEEGAPPPFCPRRAAFWWWTPNDPGPGGQWNSSDLDEDYATQFPLSESRAEALTVRAAERDWLLVGGGGLRRTARGRGDCLVRIRRRLGPKRTNTDGAIRRRR